MFSHKCFQSVKTCCGTCECNIIVVCLQIWRQLFSPLHCLNFGVGGDATQHVLWRLSNGELDNISPKVQNSARNREHDHACLFTQKTDCAQLCVKIPLPGTLGQNISDMCSVMHCFVFCCCRS